MKLVALALILPIVLTAFAVAECRSEPASGRFLAYTIEPVIEDRSVMLNVTVSFRLPGSKGTRLVLPSDWQGQRELYKAIHDLEAVSPGVAVLKGDVPWSRQVTFPQGRSCGCVTE